MQQTAVMIRQGTKTPVLRRVRAAHRLLTAQLLVLDGSGSETPMFMKLSDHLLWLSQHNGNVVPQPAHSSQIEGQ